MRIMTLHAIPDRWRMHGLGGIELFLVMAAQAQRLRGRSRQLDSRDVFGDAHFVAAQASGRDRRMHGFAFALIFVALQALRRIDILVQRNRVRLRENRGRHYRQNKKRGENLGEDSPFRRTISSRAPCDFGNHATLAFARPCPNLDRPAIPDQESVTVCNRTSSRPSCSLLRISTTSGPCPNGLSPALSLVEITHGPVEFCDCNHTVSTPA